MTRVIDPEEMASKLSVTRAALGDMAQLPGLPGVTARLGLATMGSDKWLAAEVARGTPYWQIVSASIDKAAAVVIARTAPMSPESRAKVIEILLGQISRGLANIDGMTPEQRAASSIRTHSSN
jgi:hypothetical protein